MEVSVNVRGLSPQEQGQRNLWLYYAETFGLIAVRNLQYLHVEQDPDAVRSLSKRAVTMTRRAAHEAFRACPSLRGEM